jgi:hypothetical protein
MIIWLENSKELLFHATYSPSRHKVIHLQTGDGDALLPTVMVFTMNHALDPEPDCITKMMSIVPFSR